MKSNREYEKQWLKCRLMEWVDLIVFTPFCILIFIIGVIMIMTGDKYKKISK